MHLTLIGMRGSGKTTVGRIVALALKRPFVDTDEWIARTTGRTIAELIVGLGEPGFRKIESDAITEALGNPHKVIALGGGGVLSGANRERLRAGGFCVWLRASAETLAGRVRNDPATAAQRPSLTGGDAISEIAEILESRNHLYASTSHATIDVDQSTPDQVASAILSLFATYQPLPS